MGVPMDYMFMHQKCVDHKSIFFNSSDWTFIGVPLNRAGPINGLYVRNVILEEFMAKSGSYGAEFEITADAFNILRTIRHAANSLDTNAMLRTG
ncbi:unnamed protein product [Caenorhabditis angaria]|uniref:Uncharacterized protein n=1 Tax=Caenorhabditis angaria TaxID=860376 RepID=A0A9P1N9T9_9PELO|nr:unnamed protein product [Caenorhabditis angaria]